MFLPFNEYEAVEAEVVEAEASFEQGRTMSDDLELRDVVRS